MIPIQSYTPRLTIKNHWSVHAGAPVYADILLAGNTIVVATAAGDLISYDRDGNERWRKKIMSDYSLLLHDPHKIPRITSSPVFFNRTIYAGSLEGNMHAFSPDGKQKWSFSSGSPIRSTPAEAQGNIIFGTDEGAIIMLSPLGKMIWKTKIGYPISSRITAESVDGVMRIHFGASDNRLYSLGMDGKIRWAYQADGAIHGKAGIGEIDTSGKTAVFAGSADSAIQAITHDGKLHWKRDTGGTVMPDVILTKSDEGYLTLIAGIRSHDQHILTLSGQNNIIDSFPTGSSFSSSPAIFSHETGKKIVFGSSDHHLYIIDAHPTGLLKGALGKSVYMFDTGDIVSGTPAFTEDKIICANASGTVCCLSLT